MATEPHQFPLEHMVEEEAPRNLKLMVHLVLEMAVLMVLVKVVSMEQAVVSAVRVLAGQVGFLMGTMPHAVFLKVETIQLTLGAPLVMDAMVASEEVREQMEMVHLEEVVEATPEAVVEIPGTVQHGELVQAQGLSMEESIK